MPLTVQQLRESIPKTNRAHVDPDPAKNNVLANMKALYDLLAPAKDANDYEVDPLRASIRSILQAVDGKGNVAEADTVLRMLSDSQLHTLYLRDIKKRSNLFEGENKEKARNLIQHIALGLNLEDRYDATEKQKADVKAKRDADKAKAEADKALADEAKRKNEEALRKARNDRADQIAREENARLKEEQKKDVYTLIEEMKARVGKLPKPGSTREFSESFLSKYPTPEARENVLKEEVKNYVKAFMSMRFAIGQTRNDVDHLKRKYNDQDYAQASELIENCETLNEFMNSMSYSDLKSLAVKGHGGAFEEAFEKYVKNLAPKIPDDVPQYYMPKAIDRIYSLKNHIKSRDFMNKDPEHRISTYMEILAVRAAVNSKRGDKTTLDPVIRKTELNRQREILENGDVARALNRIIERDGEAVIRNAATPTFGHGGELEDLIRREVKTMSLDPDNNYRLPNTPKRYAPTYGERVSDLHGLLKSPDLSTEMKMEKIAELAQLNHERLTNQDSEYIKDPARLNQATAYEYGVISRIMPRSTMNAIIADVQQNGQNSTAYKTYKQEHKGEIAAAKILQNIFDDANSKENTLEDIKLLAAKKLYVDMQLSNFEWDTNKSQDLLESQVSDLNVNLGATEIMKNENFNKMCEELGVGALMMKMNDDKLGLIQQFAVYNGDGEIAPEANEINAPQNKKEDLFKQNENGDLEVKLIP